MPVSTILKVETITNFSFFLAIIRKIFTRVRSKLITAHKAEKSITSASMAERPCNNTKLNNVCIYIRLLKQRAAAEATALLGKEIRVGKKSLLLSRNIHVFYFVVFNALFLSFLRFFGSFLFSSFQFLHFFLFFRLAFLGCFFRFLLFFR